MGAKVYCVRFNQGKKRVPCELCGGTSRVSIVGSDRTVYCPAKGCTSGSKWLDEDVTYAVITGPLTLRKVTIEYTDPTHSNPFGDPYYEVRYMAEETGVGSGTCYYQRDLYPTYDEAKAHADAKGAVIRHV